MGPRTFVAVVLVALLALSMASPTLAQEGSGQVIGQPNLEFSSSVGALTPGTTTQISLAVTNRGQISRSGPSQYEQRVTTARGVVLQVQDDDAPFEVNTGRLAIGSVQDGGVQQAQLSLSVAADAEPGTYELPVEYEYGYTRVVTYGQGAVEYRDVTRSETGTLEVTVDDGPRFEVDDVSSGVLVGQSGEVDVTLRNAGDEAARDASVTVESRSQDLTFGSGSQSATSHAGRLRPGQTRTVTYEAAATGGADPGNYTVDLSVSYTNPRGIDGTSRSIPVALPVGEEQRFALADVESSLRAGYEGELRGSIENRGPLPIENPEAVLQTDSESITITSPTEALPDLAPGERTDVNFSVDVGSDAGVSRQQFELVVNFDTPTDDRLASSPLRPTVRIEPRRDRFGVEAADGAVPAGESRAVEVNVTNQGEEVLRNVEANTFFSGPLSGGDGEGYVQELRPGETASFVVDVSAAADANPETRAISVDFRYDLPDGDGEVSTTYRVPITVTEAEEGGSVLPLLAVAAVVVGVAVFLYRRRG